jgi:hypothetical protein
MRVSLQIICALGMFAFSGLGATGCGSSSKDDPDPDDRSPEGGESAGSGGTKASAGSGGTAARGGSSPVGGTGASGGRGGSAGADEPGSSGQGGASGALAAGAGGREEAGSGGGGPTIPPELPENCDSVCEKLEQTDCPGQQPNPQCAVACKAAIEQPECVDAFETLFACAEDSEVVCNGAEPTLSDCDAEFTSAFECAIKNLSDPELEAPCADYCARAADLDCAIADCEATCQSAGSVVPSCKPLWTDFLACSDDKTLTCSAFGPPIADECQDQAISFLLCTQPIDP